MRHDFAFDFGAATEPEGTGHANTHHSALVRRADDCLDLVIEGAASACHKLSASEAHIALRSFRAGWSV
jgi:hypothetical protein